VHAEEKTNYGEKERVVFLYKAYAFSYNGQVSLLTLCGGMEAFYEFKSQ